MPFRLIPKILIFLGLKQKKLLKKLRSFVGDESIKKPI
jgi:hypothetical protein